MPKTQSQNKFYRKDDDYDKDIKNQINRVDSLFQQKVPLDYVNGNVEVIIPGQN